MMKNKTKNPILIICLLLLIACDFHQVEVEHPETEKALVIQAFLIPNNTAFTFYQGKVVAEITEMRSLNESYNNDTIKEALVTMSYGNGLTDTLAYNSLYNNYQSAIRPEQGIAYTLKVVYMDFPTVTAEDVLPVKVDLDSVKIEPFVRVDNLGASVGQATIYFKDPPESTNYYEVEITRGYNSNSGLVLFTDEPVVTREFYYPENIELQSFEPHRFLFSDYSLGSGQQALTFFFNSRTSSGSLGNKISAGYFTVKFRSVSKSYYNYFASYLDYMFNISGDALLGTCEPKNIIGNAENGYGLFGAYQEVFSEIYFDEISY